MNKQERQMTWMNITINQGDGDMGFEISIQDFLDGDISCITGIPWEDDNPQRDMFVEDFFQILQQEWGYKQQRDYEKEKGGMVK